MQEKAESGNFATENLRALEIVFMHPWWLELGKLYFGGVLMMVCPATSNAFQTLPNRPSNAFETLLESTSNARQKHLKRTWKPRIQRTAQNYIPDTYR